MSRLSWKNAADMVTRPDGKGGEESKPEAYAAAAQDGPYALCVLGVEWAVVHRAESGARKGASGVAADHMAARARAEQVAAELRDLLIPATVSAER